MEHSILPCHPLPHPLAGDPEKTAYLDIVSDGHFWRTSSILSAVYIVREDGEYRKHAFSADPAREDDEFRLRADGYHGGGLCERQLGRRDDCPERRRDRERLRRGV